MAHLFEVERTARCQPESLYCGLMSYLIVDGMGNNRADTRSRIANCSGFFSLDAFDARPVDTRMLMRQL